MDMIIYGAQGYALGAYNAIKKLQPEKNVRCFAVTSMGSNASHLCALPVKEIAAVSEEFSAEEKKSTEVLIATPANVHAKIEATLDKLGFSCHKRLTSELWNVMMRELYHATGEFRPLADLPAGDLVPSVDIYMAKSHVDKPLTETFELPLYMKPVQVGAANTDERIAEIRDDEGDSISKKNGNYCELTGLYWVWKNALTGDLCKAEYCGFAQYRRILMLSEEDLSRLAANDVDVVLPYPLLYEPDINAHHQRYIKDADWTALLKAIRELQPQYADAVHEILAQKYMFNYNVILAKRKVLDDYCSWLFPILERTEELSDPKECDRSDRYIGYMGETLETLYFLKNRDKLKITHAGCRLLV